MGDDAEVVEPGMEGFEPSVDGVDEGPVPGVAAQPRKGSKAKMFVVIAGVVFVVVAGAVGWQWLTMRHARMLSQQRAAGGLTLRAQGSAQMPSTTSAQIGQPMGQPMAQPGVAQPPNGGVQMPSMTPAQMGQPMAGQSMAQPGGAQPMNGAVQMPGQGFAPRAPSGAGQVPSQVPSQAPPQAMVAPSQPAQVNGALPMGVIAPRAQSTNLPARGEPVQRLPASHGIASRNGLMGLPSAAQAQVEQNVDANPDLLAKLDQIDRKLAVLDHKVRVIDVRLAHEHTRVMRESDDVSRGGYVASDVRLGAVTGDAALIEINGVWKTVRRGDDIAGLGRVAKISMEGVMFQGGRWIKR